MKIVFMGTPEFSVPCLKKLVELNLEITGVFTQPDKPKGRGYKLIPPPVKEFALQENIPVFQPSSLKSEDTQELIRSLKPDLIVVVAYGKILPKAVLDIPPMGCINVHASLLPKYRGAGPIQWCVINGETETGVTTMFMSEGLDTGDMILKRSISIGPDETAGELHDRLALLGAECLEDTVKLFADNKPIPRTKQEDSQSCYAPMLDKKLCAIDFSEPAQKVHNLVRGLSPWPVACTAIGSDILKIHQTAITNIRCPQPNTPGAVTVKDGRMFVTCSDFLLEILRVQLEGKKAMSVHDFLLGHQLSSDTVLKS